MNRLMTIVYTHRRETREALDLASVICNQEIHRGILLQESADKVKMGADFAESLECFGYSKFAFVLAMSGFCASLFYTNYERKMLTKELRRRVDDSWDRLTREWPRKGRSKARTEHYARLSYYDF